MISEPKKLPLSVVIITLNEATSLPDCLNSIQFAQDIVVMDSGSTDQTLTIAKNKGARTFHQPWLGYGQQKNEAIKKAKFDWILCLDADERPDEQLTNSIHQTMNTPNPPFNGYRMARKNHFFGYPLKHGFGYPDYKIRLINRNFGEWTQPLVHETIQIKGPVGLLKGNLLHLSGENLQTYLDKHNRYTTLQANSMKNNPPKWLKLRMVVNPILCFLKGYFLKKAFLDGIPGLVHTTCHCFTTFIKYAKLYDTLRQKNEEKRHSHTFS